MQKKLNTFINSSILMSILFVVLGIILIIFPKTSLEVLALIIGILLIVNGIYLIILDIKARNNFFPIVDTLMSGILATLFGIIMLIYPNMLSIIIPIILGTWFILFSIFKIRLSLSLRKYDSTPWILALIISILSMLCGIILVIDPISSSITITLFSGIMMIVYSVSDIVDMILFKKNINKIIKYFKEKMKIIEG